MMIVSVPIPVLLGLATFGLISLSYILYVSYLNISSYVKFKRPHRDIKEHKIFLLEEEIQRLNKKIELLEEENQQITYSFIKNMKGG
tara:strand:+ start:95 stop:355 length:261 start_codon:yes stop_codon:yes gene_type:complete